jgi:hypothetical protein
MTIEWALVSSMKRMKNLKAKCKALTKERKQQSHKAKHDGKSITGVVLT